MTVPTATITFDCDGTVLTLPAPVPGYATESRRAQTIGQTAAGADYVYDKGYSLPHVELTVELSATQRANLETFFNSTTVGGVNTFTYTDHYGTAHASCRFLEPTLKFTKLPSARYRCKLKLRTGSVVD